MPVTVITTVTAGSCCCIDLGTGTYCGGCRNSTFCVYVPGDNPYFSGQYSVIHNPNAGFGCSWVGVKDDVSAFFKVYLDWNTTTGEVVAFFEFRFSPTGVLLAWAEYKGSDFGCVGGTLNLTGSSNVISPETLPNSISIVPGPCDIGTGSGTGSGTGTGTGCACPIDLTFCVYDGTEYYPLGYSTDCMWATSGGGPPTSYDPASGTVRRGIFPANYADYEGPTGCDGGVYVRVGGTAGPEMPDELTITPGACPDGTGSGTGPDCHEVQFCATVPDFDCLPGGPTDIGLTEVGSTGVFTGTTGTVDLAIDTTISPVTMLADAGGGSDALYESDDFGCLTGGTFTLVSGDGCAWPTPIVVNDGNCGV